MNDKWIVAACEDFLLRAWPLGGTTTAEECEKYRDTPIVLVRRRPTSRRARCQRTQFM